jgi:hypothetical protein
MRNKTVTSIPDFIKDLIYDTYVDQTKTWDPNWPFNKLRGDGSLLIFDYLWFLTPDRKNALLFSPSEETKKNLREAILRQSYFDLMSALPESEFHRYTGRRPIRLRLNTTKENGGYIEVQNFNPPSQSPFEDKYLGLMEKPRCIQCHAEFIQKRPWQIYCSKKCKIASFSFGRWIRRNIENDTLMESLRAECLNCGKILPEEKRSNRKFCGINCRVAYHRKKKVLG